MKINLLSNNEWILGRLAKELQNYIPGALRNANIPCDIDYCIPYTNCFSAKAPIKVGLFTHYEENDKEKQKRYKEALDILDAHIFLSYSSIIRYDHGEKPWAILPLGTDLKKDIVFGVVGNVKDSGRKNEHFALKMRDELRLHVMALGEGWHLPIWTARADDDTGREAFYKNIDYLVVTSSNEGGPVPVLEAIAMGVPVIAPDVGWCWHYPVIKYERNDWGSLCEILQGLTQRRTWKDVADDHFTFFKSLCEKNQSQ